MPKKPKIWATEPLSIAERVILVPSVWSRSFLRASAVVLLTRVGMMVRLCKR